MIQPEQISTSYFSMIKWAPANTAVVSIARRTPHWVKCSEYRDLAPSDTLLQQYKYQGMTPLQYTVRYEAELALLDQRVVLSDLENLAGENPIWLCCWEDRLKFCHRHLAAEWLQRHRPELIIKEWQPY